MMCIGLLAAVPTEKLHKIKVTRDWTLFLSSNMNRQTGFGKNPLAGQEQTHLRFISGLEPLSKVFKVVSESGSPRCMQKKNLQRHQRTSVEIVVLTPQRATGCLANQGNPSVFVRLNIVIRCTVLEVGNTTVKRTSKFRSAQELKKRRSDKFDEGNNVTTSALSSGRKWNDLNRAKKS